MISGVKPFARTRLKGLGYREWTDAFDFENIPSTQLGKSFHLTLGDSVAQKQNQDNIDVETALKVRVFIPPGRDSVALVDEAIAAGDEIIDDFIRTPHQNSLELGVYGVDFDRMTVKPLSDSNDQGMMVEIDFQVLVIFSTL